MIPDKTLSSENVDYMISILTSALMGTMSVWLDNNQNKTPDELAHERRQRKKLQDRIQ